MNNKSTALIQAVIRTQGKSLSALCVVLFPINKKADNQFFSQQLAYFLQLYPPDRTPDSKYSEYIQLLAAFMATAPQEYLDAMLEEILQQVRNSYLEPI